MANNTDPFQTSSLSLEDWGEAAFDISRSMPDRPRKTFTPRSPSPRTEPRPNPSMTDNTDSLQPPSPPSEEPEDSLEAFDLFGSAPLRSHPPPPPQTPQPPSSPRPAPRPNPGGASPTYTIGDLRAAPDNLLYRLHVLAHDLHNFAHEAAARDRLERVVDPSYIGPPYFSAAEAELVRSLDVGGRALGRVVADTLEERLDRRAEKRERSGDYRVCAAHDLAPVVERALGVGEKEVARDEGFRGLVGEKGLVLGEGEGWRGLRRQRQFGAGNGKGGKKKGGRA